MSQVITANPVPTAWVQQAAQNPLAFLKTIDDLLENFGADAVGNAATQKFLNTYAEGLRDIIDDSHLPEGIKQMANAIIDQFLSDVGATCPCTGEVSDAVDNSELGNDISDAAREAIEETRNESGCANVESECTGSAGVESGEADAEATKEAENEGAAGGGAHGCANVESESTGSASVESGEAHAEATKEAENEGAAAGGADESAKAKADAALNDLLAGTGESEELKKKKHGGGGSFLEALAIAMGTVQGNLLNRAKDQSDLMVKYSNNEDSANDFTMAQAKYSALMQMFNIYSTQVATTLKTCGESMSAIARKQ